MARSKIDNLKRKTAQAMNHLAQAVMDVYEIQQEFEAQHPDLGAVLAQVTIATNANREMLAAFAFKAWMLDEEAILSYI